uniref:Uncharacterized protein n=2 Tax=viral metagenome TaxID=1070528 RepID=A0A6M3IGY2_9ZZZZ
MKIFMGIDPGETGAFAIIDADMDVIALADFHDRQYAYPADKSSMKAVIEEAQSMPKQGVSSTFKYGVNFGRWLEWLDIAGIPYQRIRPAKWKKAVCDGGARRGKDGKEYSLELARRLFPSVSEELKRKKDHNRAEALLIALYCRNQWEK